MSEIEIVVPFGAPISEASSAEAAVSFVQGVDDHEIRRGDVNPSPLPDYDWTHQGSVLNDVLSNVAASHMISADDPGLTRLHRSVSESGLMTRPPTEESSTN
jgi:hypothetical protein